MLNTDVLILDNIYKSYREGQGRLDVLCGASLSIKKGEMVALVGPSGCGKSTLLHIAGLLDNPDKGHMHIAGIDASLADDAARARMRQQHLGFVYQFHHLLPEFSAWENIAMPLRLAGISKRRAREKAEALLAQMQLSPRGEHRPSELSGGEQQRVAIARALATDPSVLLMDEPTGNLDPHTAADVFSALIKAVKAQGIACLMVTHNMELARSLDRMITLKDGVVEKLASSTAKGKKSSRKA